MKSTHKALLLTLCAALLVAASVFGTLAYLTSTDEVVNTFTVGKVELKLDEADVKPDGTLETEKRVKKNDYHLLPGHTYIKDPTVTVGKDSEDAYVRMIVEVKNIDKLKLALPNEGATAKYYGADGTFLLQMLCGGWDPAIWLYEGYDEDNTTGIYEFRYKKIVAQADNATSAAKLEPLFTDITVPGEIDGTHLKHLDDVEIVVTAHAIQADGFENDEDLAWRKFDDPNAR